MLARWLIRDPAVSFRLAVYLCAGLVFPLHLGWIGASGADLLVYLAIAAVILATPVALLVEPLAHPRWQAMLLVAVPNLLFLAVPAAAAFWLGSALGPLDEAFDGEVCASQGLVEMDTVIAEANDTVDVIPDCE